MTKELQEALTGAAFTTIIYIIIVVVRSTLEPSFARLAFTSSQSHAKRVLEAWKDAKTKGRAFVVIGIELVLLLPMYVTTAWMLAAAVDDPTRRVITKVNGFALGAVLLGAFAHLLQNGCLLVTLIAGARKVVVFLTPIFSWIKNTLLALAMVYIIFRAEIYLKVTAEELPLTYTLTLLAMATLVVAILTARMQTALSRAHPPLLALQLAPSRAAAKDVLERWGEKGRKEAHRALLLQSLFAMLYGVTLAIICDRVPDFYKYIGIELPLPENTFAVLSWTMLIAAAFHFAQNLGAYIALRLRFMGSWGGVMRGLGWVRMGLLVVAGAAFAVLLLHGEWLVGKWLAGQIPAWRNQTAATAAATPATPAPGARSPAPGTPPRSGGSAPRHR